MNFFQWVAHKIFGFDFVIVGFGGQCIRRIRYMPNGRPFVRTYGVTQFLDEVPFTPLTWSGTEKPVANDRRAA